MHHLRVVPVCFYGLSKLIHYAALSTLLFTVYDNDYDKKTVIGERLLYTLMLLSDFIV